MVVAAVVVVVVVFVATTVLDFLLLLFPLPLALLLPPVHATESEPKGKQARSGQRLGEVSPRKDARPEHPGDGPVVLFRCVGARYQSDDLRDDAPRRCGTAAAG